MKRKMTGILLAAALMFSLLIPAALADGEEQDVPAETAAGESASAEAEAPLPEPEEEAPAPAPEPEMEAEAAVPVLELPAEEAPPEEEILLLTDDDPMSARAGKTNATVGTKTYSDFTTRALDNETLHKGIDVSEFQGSINWSKVAASGVEFVIIRAAYRGCTYGTLGKDPMFTTNIKGAQAAGLKVGVYIFSQAITTAEAVEEANYLISLVKNYSIDLPLVLDYEFALSGRLEKASLTRQQRTDICNAFCRQAEQSGYESMVYANPNMLNNYLYASQLGRLWLANYTTKTGYSGAKYEYWQCSDSGKVDGISCAVDLDFWFEPNTFPFKDVSETNWYYEAVSAAYSQGIVTGMTANSFSPGGTATRGQVVTMLYRMEGQPDWTETAGFEDLTQDYYRDAVYWAAENKVVNGFSETKFGPGQSITREQLVTILHRMAQCPQAEGDLSDYADADSVQAWAADAMAWAVEAGIVTGYEDATLRPQNEATRAEVCTFLMRYAAL